MDRVTRAERGLSWVILAYTQQSVVRLHLAAFSVTQKGRGLRHAPQLVLSTRQNLVVPAKRQTIGPWLTHERIDLAVDDTWRKATQSWLIG